VTLKVNLLKLLPPTKNEFTFQVKGTILLDVQEADFVPLPTFHVLGSDKGEDRHHRVVFNAGRHSDRSQAPTDQRGFLD